MPYSMPKLLSEQEYEAALPAIKATLDALRETAVITSADGCQIYCERYLKEENSTNLLIVHGFTEFSAKYREMIHLFLSVGFNVFIFDQRGHGFSGREVEDLRLAHVGKFESYAEDLAAVMDQWVLPATKGMPLYLFSHSMGGAASLLYLADHPGLVEKAILCSPMVRPLTRGVPRPIVLAALWYYGRKEGWDQKFPHSPEFSKTPGFDAAPDESYARFKANLDIRIRHPEYQNSSATNGWLMEALTVERKLLTAKVFGIETPMLMLRAGNDQIVCNKAQARLLKKLRNCRQLLFADAKHTIFAGKPETIQAFYSAIFDFINE